MLLLIYILYWYLMKNLSSHISYIIFLNLLYSMSCNINVLYDLTNLL